MFYEIRTRSHLNKVTTLKDSPPARVLFAFVVCILLLDGAFWMARCAGIFHHGARAVGRGAACSTWRRR
jgi:hypothetical protein